MIRKKILSSGSQTSTPISEEKADFLSFIKCKLLCIHIKEVLCALFLQAAHAFICFFIIAGVKILKRKMRNRYEQKVSNEAGVVSGINESETMSKEHKIREQAGSLESDVTDIFLPVPSTSQNNVASQGGISIVDPSLEEHKCSQQVIETEKTLEYPNSDSEESEDSEPSKTEDS